jgi:hypothetical protein
MPIQTRPCSLSISAEFDSLDQVISFLESVDGSIKNFELKFDDEAVDHIRKNSVPYVRWVDVSAPTVKISHQAIDIPSNFFEVALPFAEELSTIVDSPVTRDSKERVIKCARFFRDATTNDVVFRIPGVDMLYVLNPSDYRSFCETGLVPFRL